MKPRLLLFDFHHLGDAVLSFPFVRAVAESYDVWVCCRPSQKPVFAMVVPEAQILTWEPFWTRGKVWSLKEMEEQRCSLKKINAEVAVCGWADPRVHVLMVLSGAEKRVGYPMTSMNYFSWKASGSRKRLWEGKVFQGIARFMLGKKLLTASLKRESWTQPHWKDWQQLGEALGFEVSMKTPWVSTGYGKSEKDRGGKAQWLLHMGSRLRDKQWPAEGFASVAQHYLDPEGFDWICIAPKDEVGKLPGSLEAKKAETPEWDDLVAAVAKTEAVLCHDSAVAHLASALGKRVVALFGPRPTCWFAPYDNEGLSVCSSGGDRGGLPTLNIKVSAVIEKMKAANT